MVFLPLQGDGAYVWLDGFLVKYTNWGENEPSMENGGGCVALHVDGFWKDDLCTNIYSYVCKYTTGDYLSFSFGFLQIAKSVRSAQSHVMGNIRMFITYHSFITKTI